MAGSPIGGDESIPQGDWLNGVLLRGGVEHAAHTGRGSVLGGGRGYSAGAALDPITIPSKLRVRALPNL